MLNEKPTRKWLSREDTSSATSSLEAIFNRKIDTYEERDIMVLDVTNAFIQTNMPPKKYEK